MANQCGGKHCSLVWYILIGVSLRRQTRLSCPIQCVFLDKIVGGGGGGEGATRMGCDEPPYISCAPKSLFFKSFGLCRIVSNKRSFVTFLRLASRFYH